MAPTQWFRKKSGRQSISTRQTRGACIAYTSHKVIFFYDVAINLFGIGIEELSPFKTIVSDQLLPFI